MLLPAPDLPPLLPQPQRCAASRWGNRAWLPHAVPRAVTHAVSHAAACRAERAGDREAVKGLLERLFKNDYRFIGIDAKVGGWVGIGRK